MIRQSLDQFIASLCQREVWRECQYGCGNRTKKELSCEQLFLKCHTLPDYRTFIDDYLKILDFIEWLKVAYPEKAKFLIEKS